MVKSAFVIRERNIVLVQEANIISECDLDFISYIRAIIGSCDSFLALTCLNHMARFSATN